MQGFSDLIFGNESGTQLLFSLFNLFRGYYTTQLTEKKTVSISAHVPLGIAEKLEKISQLEERTQSYYIEKSLEQFLQEKLEDVEDYIDAKKTHETFVVSEEKSVAWEEVVKKYQALEAQEK